MSQLKPCPFCGSKNLYAARIYVICRNCGAEGPVKSEPEKEWNTRDTADLRAAQIRALESLQVMYVGGDIACAEDEINAMRADIRQKITELKNGGELI